MTYRYDVERPKIFTEEGQRLFLAVRDRAQFLLKEAGAARVAELMRLPSIGAYGSWEALACIDRLVELGELREVTDEAKVVGQHRVFVAGKRDV